MREQDSGLMGGKGSLKGNMQAPDEGDRKLGSEQGKTVRTDDELSQIPPSVESKQNRGPRDEGLLGRHIEAMCGAGSDVAPGSSRNWAVWYKKGFARRWGRKMDTWRGVWGNIRPLPPADTYSSAVS